MCLGHVFFFVSGIISLIFSKKNRFLGSDLKLPNRETSGKKVVHLYRSTRQCYQAKLSQTMAPPQRPTPSQTRPEISGRLYPCTSRIIFNSVAPSTALPPPLHQLATREKQRGATIREHPHLSPVVSSRKEYYTSEQGYGRGVYFWGHFFAVAWGHSRS